MSFLNPIALLGLLAATIPIIIHLLNLRKLKVVEFSSLKFLKELQKNKLRKIRIKQIILLILRVLAIAFLALAFSRPTVKNFNLNIIGSEAKSTVFIFLDNSLSMSLVDKNGEYLAHAKRKAIDIAKSLNETDDIYLIPFGEVDLKRKDYLPISKLFLEREISKINFSYSTTNYDNIMILTEKILSNSSNFQKDIFIISDFQKGNFPEKAVDLNNAFDNLTNLYLIDIGKKSPINYSIDSLKITDKIFELLKPINFEVYLKNWSNDDVNDLVTDISFNNEKVSQRSIDIPKNESRAISLIGKAKNSGFIAVKSETEDDDFIYDNTYYNGLFIPDKINILLATDNLKDANFIRLALSQTFDETSESQNKITQINTNQIYSYNLDKFDVIFIIGTENIKDFSRLKTFIENGGKVCILPGSESSPISFNNFTSVLGFRNMEGVTGDKTNKSAYLKFNNIDYSHPIFKNIFIDDTKRNIESPKIFYTFNYKQDVNSQSIIDYQNGYAFLLEHNSGNGKVMLFTTSTDLDWSDFSLKGIFLPLINKIVLYLIQNENRIEKLNIGKNQIVPLSGRNEKRLKLITPDNIEKILDVEENKAYQYVVINDVEIPGHYYLKDNEKILKMIVVNINNNESNLIKASEKEIKQFFNQVNSNYQINYINTDDEIIKLIQQSRIGTELWKFFLILTLICLITEMIIARTSKKDLLQ